MSRTGRVSGVKGGGDVYNMASSGPERRGVTRKRDRGRMHGRLLVVPGECVSCADLDWRRNGDQPKEATPRTIE